MTALACLGYCGACGRPAPGMESRRYHRRVELDFHLHPVPLLFVCIGSRQPMQWWSTHMRAMNWTVSPQARGGGRSQPG